MDQREQVTLDWRGVMSDTVTDQSLSGLAVLRTYRGDTGWLTGILAGDASGPTGVNPLLQNLSYSHDAIGNVISRHDSNTFLNEVFAYDDLNRLSTVTRTQGTTALGVESYLYDPWGNLLAKPGLSGIGYQTKETQAPVPSPARTR